MAVALSSRKRLSLAEARRLALAAQGLDRPRPSGRVDVRHVRRVMATQQVLQLDFVNVLVPAHQLVLYSRLGNYRQSLLADLAYQRRELVEQWAHERALVPASLWPLFHHRRQNHRVWPKGFERFLAERSAYTERVLEQVRRQGPLTAADIEADEAAGHYVAGAWLSTVEKATLEALFGYGHLAIARREPNFARVYDLSERVLPAEIHSQSMDKEPAVRELMLLAARAHGVGTAKDLADYFRVSMPEARPALHDLVAQGLLGEVEVEGWNEAAYLHPEARLPRSVRARALLSPFDPVVWCRPRAERLFAFEYRIEIYVPASKRRWGYYVLPFLLGDQLVARVDLRADRGKRCLRVEHAWLEPGQDAARVLPPLLEELREMAAWLDLPQIQVAERGDLAPALAKHLARGS